MMVAQLHHHSTARGWAQLHHLRQSWNRELEGQRIAGASVTHSYLVPTVGILYHEGNEGMECWLGLQDLASTAMVPG